MTNRGVLVAGAMLIVANALILGGVLRNRAGNPDAVLRLGERELESWGGASEGAEPLLELRLRWETAPGVDGMPWFDRARLEALGERHLPSADDTTRNYGWMRPTHRGYVVLELAGPAWQRWKAERQAAADSNAAVRAAAIATLPEGAKPLLSMDSSATRLMAVDFGLDPLALRQQYPERSQYLILPATYRADVTPAVRDSSGLITAAARVEGTINQLLPGTVHVPRPLRDSLLALGAATRDSTTHFEVTLKVGRKWEVWVE